MRFFLVASLKELCPEKTMVMVLPCKGLKRHRRTSPNASQTKGGFHTPDSEAAAATLGCIILLGIPISFSS